MTTHVLALDQGTTSSRSILFDARGDVVAVAQREFTQHFPRSGWVEHDAQEIWATQAATIAEVLARARLTAADVAAIGITNQRETTVLWDRATGRPVAPAIVWQDRRTADACARAQDRAATRRRSRVARAWCSIPISRRPSLRGCSTATRALRARAERGELAFGTIDSWLVWNLTGWRRARQRRHQREPHAAAQHRNRRLGSVAARAVSRAGGGAATCGGVLPRRAMHCPRESRDARFRSAASPAISRRRSSARRASSRGWRRTPTAPAASC